MFFLINPPEWSKNVVNVENPQFLKENYEFLSVICLKWEQSVCSITLLYSSTFYSLFLPFFVLEIFKFKYDKVFVRHSASISKFEWFEQLCGWNLNKSKNLDQTANVIDPYWKWSYKINKCFFGDSIIFCIAILMFLLGKEKSLLFILGKCL